MVVDDEPYLRSFLRNLLESKFTVDTAGDGVEALKLAQKQPEVILIDVLMPGMLGLDLCRALRSERNAAAIVMVTALDDDELRSACLAAGANDLITKPFHPDELFARIARCLDA